MAETVIIDNAGDNITTGGMYAYDYADDDIALVTGQADDPWSPDTAIQSRQPNGLTAGSADGTYGISFNDNVQRYLQMLWVTKVDAGFKGQAAQNKEGYGWSDVGYMSNRFVMCLVGAGSDPLYPSIELQNTNGGGDGFYNSGTPVDRDAYFLNKLHIYHSAVDATDGYIKRWVDRTGAGWGESPEIDASGLTLHRDADGCTDGYPRAWHWSHIWGGAGGPALDRDNYIWMGHFRLSVADDPSEFTDPLGSETGLLTLLNSGFKDIKDIYDFSSTQQKQAALLRRWFGQPLPRVPRIGRSGRIHRVPLILTPSQVQR